MSRSRSPRHYLRAELFEQPHRISLSCALVALFLAGLTFATGATYMGSGHAVVASFLLFVSSFQYRKHARSSNGRRSKRSKSMDRL
ncbi:hypothetical protein [Haladaptatus sp. CMAA 1911]|uniref:hypothetical protein n=1 Tax=unclassified Haladaptatus TaxID=2622732 RepID=UPI0037552092